VIDPPPVRRVLLGAALRQYRENLGLVLEDAARVLECDRSKISRIETGQRGIRPKELRELLTEYGIGEPEQGTLATIARAGHRSSWWQAYSDTISETYRDYLALEQAATDILLYDPQRIPDLLQTPQYAQARAAAVPSIPADTGQGTPAALILVRQEILDERRVRLTTVITEAALRQLTGGTDVMHDQLKALTDVGNRSTVQVLPSAYETPSSGPATILRFARMSSLGVVYLPGLSGGVCLAGQQDVASYASAFERLRASALTPAASTRLIREMTGE
jgi:transcriptional regulator with XRE-family HTH domain